MSGAGVSGASNECAWSGGAASGNGGDGATPKRPALAAAADLLRMEGLDFSMDFSRPAAELLARGNIVVFTVQHVAPSTGTR